MYEMGKIEDNPDAKGLAFPIHPPKLFVQKLHMCY